VTHKITLGNIKKYEKIFSIKEFSVSKQKNLPKKSRGVFVQALILL